MAAYEIPLTPRPQRLSIALSGTTYQLRLHFANAEGGGWLLDIADNAGTPIVCGIPLVTGANLLEQYATLGFGGKLFVRSDGDPGTVPTFANLGIGSHLYWEPN